MHSSKKDLYGCDFLRRYFPFVFLFVIGGTLYVILEFLWRGYSHWSMFLAGGTCFSLVDAINKRLKKNTPLWVRCTVGAAIITGVEFITGCLVNLWAQWNVWDYSRFRYQVMGQICLVYTVIWFFLSAPLLWLTGWLRRGFEKILGKE